MTDKQASCKKQIKWEATEKIDPPEDNDNDNYDDDNYPNTNWLNNSWIGLMPKDLPPLETDDSPSKITPTVADTCKTSTEMSQILPNLYIGTINHAKDSAFLQKNNITSIVSVYAEASPLDQTHPYLCISVADTSSQNIRQFFSTANDFIHDGRSKGAVLVQCTTGISSSVTLAIAYIMTVTDLPLSKAINIVQRQRPQAQPNVGFLRQLGKFETEDLAQERQRFRSKFLPSQDKCNDQEQCESILKTKV